jgi:uncharacterized membrane protein YraQ (UPF0718 family)
MEAITQIIYQTLLQTVTSFAHNWPFLIISIVISVLLKLFLDSDKAARFLLRHQRAGVLGATAVAVTTPLCSCGTTAVVLGMMASLLPWAPIVAFMVASPLTSPEELVYSAGLFGWHFAWAFFIASILLGLLGGLAAVIMEKRGWLKNQARMAGEATVEHGNSPSPRPLPQGAREQSFSPRSFPQGAREQSFSPRSLPQGAREQSFSPRSFPQGAREQSFSPRSLPQGAREQSFSPRSFPQGAREQSFSPRPLPQGAREQAQTAATGVNRWEFATVGGLTIEREDEHASYGGWDATGGPQAGGCGCGEPGEADPEVAQETSGCGCGELSMDSLKVEQATGGCSCSKPSQAAKPTQVGKEAIMAATPVCGCGSKAATVAQAQTGGCGCGTPAGGSAQTQEKPRVTWRLFFKELFSIGKRLLVMFAGFAFIGFLLNNLIPQAWVSAIFGSGNIYSVPLAATLGVPFYINTEGSLPLVRALIDGGMSQGAALAFLITGAGTSVGAVAGALTIARWRVIGLVVGTLWVGAVAVGFLYNFLLAAGLV